MIHRNEQNIADTWKLEDIFPDHEAWETALHQEIELSARMKTYSGRLSDGNALREYLEMAEQLSDLINDTYGYANLYADQDAANPEGQKMVGKAMAAAVQVSTEQSFFDVQIMEIAEKDFSDLLKKRSLRPYHRYLTEIRRLKPHTLSEKEEALLSAGQEAMNASAQTFNILNNTNMYFPDAADKEGEAHAVNSASYIQLLEQQDETLRKNAFNSLYGTYRKLGNTYASLLDGQMKQLKYNAQVRHYNTALAASLDQVNVPVSVYMNLIEAVHEDIGILHKYMKVRKKELGKEQLHMWDLYVPMVDEVDIQVPFEKAKEDCLASVQVYGSDYASIYGSGLNSRWIDIYPNEGKQSGAYSSGMRVHPYVLLNHTGTLDSEFTLAHEMGHAMHSYLSNKNQRPLDREYPIFVAEVASTCNEALLMSYLRQHTDDPKLQAYYINYFLEQYRTTLYRQTMFAEFELHCAKLCANHETLTVERLNQIYHDLNVFYYGEDMIVDPGIDYEWARIPHFYYDFYVYQYATGFSAAMALSDKILHGTQEDVDHYLQFLSAGCTQSPIDLLKLAGVDMSDPGPIHAALKQFDQLIDAFVEVRKQ